MKKLFLFVFIGMQAMAAPITGVDSFAFSFSPLNVICQQSVCTGTTPIPNSSLTYYYDAYGSANFGILRGYARATTNGSGSATGGVLASTNPYFIDTLTFLGQPLGTHGTIVFTFLVTGSNSSTAGAGGTVGLRVGLASDPIKSPPFRAPNSSGVITSQAIPFVFGQPIELRTTLFVDANIFTPAPGASSTWDYSQTVVLNGISLADGSNAPVNNFQVESASGTVYGVNGVAPEPGTLLLMLSGIALAGLKGRRPNMKRER